MSENKGGDCVYCGGWGYREDHDPHDPHVDGLCNTCPIQMPCSKCYTTGFTPFKRDLFIEKFKLEKREFKIDEDDLPF